jgi:hypothetical protein
MLGTGKMETIGYIKQVQGDKQAKVSTSNKYKGYKKTATELGNKIK